MAAREPERPLFLIGLKEIARALGCGLWKAREFVLEGGLPVYWTGAYVTTARLALEWLEARAKPVTRAEAAARGPKATGQRPRPKPAVPARH
jgi:hypothetical protein